jgi:hypothetical protein
MLLALLAAELRAPAVVILLLGFVAIIVIYGLWLFSVYRAAVEDFPRFRAARYLFWFVVAVHLLVLFSQVDVQQNQVAGFYAAMATVDAALLVAASFQTGWARGNQALEGMIFLAIVALSASLICSLVVLGRGAGNSVFLAYTVTGPAAGVMLVAYGAVHQLAPDLVQHLNPRPEEQHVGEELDRHGWTIKYPPPRSLGYDLKARSGTARLYVLVKSSVTFITETHLTPYQWKSAETHGTSYVLAIVDFLDSDEPRTWYVSAPTGGHRGGAVPPPLLRAWLEPRAVDARLLGRDDR